MSRFHPKVIVRIARDLFNCARLMGGLIDAYAYLRSRDPMRLGSFEMRGLRYRARKEDWIAIREVLVEDEYSCIDRLLLADGQPRIFDLGANIGCFALRVFLRCRGAQVVSVEAAEDTFGILAGNRCLNDSLDWQVMNNGVWRDDGPLTLMRRGISVGHRVVEGEGDDTVAGISMQTLATKLGWDDIDLIKMDIEGGEEAVVPAAVDVLLRTKVLIIEVHNDRIDAKPMMEILRFLYSHHWQLNDRRSSKPLYLMTNLDLDLGAGAWRVEA